MIVGAVVEDHVHDHLQSLLVAVVDELAILLVGAEARIHLIVIGRGIAVVGRVDALVGPVVLQHRCEPQGRHAKLLEVVEMLAYASQVAAVSQRRFRAVAGLVAHAFDDIVLRVAVGEAVGHEEVEHVGVAESLMVLTTHGTLLELIFNLP